MNIAKLNPTPSYIKANLKRHLTLISFKFNNSNSLINAGNYNSKRLFVLESVPLNRNLIT